MSPRQAAPPRTYTTGFCQVGHHYLCRGTYRFATCACPCGHDMPPPEPEPARCPTCGQPLPEVTTSAR